MSIKISSLKKPRREGRADFTYLHEESKEVRTEEIPISFLKPTEALWDEVLALEKAASKDDEGQKGLYVKQLLRVEIQSPFIIEDDGTPHLITEEDLSALDCSQLVQLWKGVSNHFFLRTPASQSETTTKSSSAQAAS